MSQVRIIRCLHKIGGNHARQRLKEILLSMSVENSKPRQELLGTNISFPQLGIKVFINVFKWEDEVEERNGLLVSVENQEPVSASVFRLDENGAIKSETEYKDGKPDGIYREFFPNGQVKSETIFKSGTAADTKSFDFNPKPDWETSYYETGTNLFKAGMRGDGIKALQQCIRYLNSDPEQAQSAIHVYVTIIWLHFRENELEAVFNPFYRIYRSLTGNTQPLEMLWS